jgi:hypothetical protein
MNTVNRSKCALLPSQNCTGSTTKKASTRLRWSLRRVGDRLMNSRSAMNATKANSTAATRGPSAQPIQNTLTMSHELLSRPHQSA